MQYTKRLSLFGPQLPLRLPPGVLLIALLSASACVNIVLQNEPSALQTAENRAKFELDCQNVQATVLSQKEVEGIRMAGSEHTIGVRGCGKEAVYVTYCRDPSDCNAFSQTGRINSVPIP